MLCKHPVRQCSGANAASTEFSVGVWACWNLLVVRKYLFPCPAVRYSRRHGSTRTYTSYSWCKSVLTYESRSGPGLGFGRCCCRWPRPLSRSYLPSCYHPIPPAPSTVLLPPCLPPVPVQTYQKAGVHSPSLHGTDRLPFASRPCFLAVLHDSHKTVRITRTHILVVNVEDRIGPSFLWFVSLRWFISDGYRDIHMLLLYLKRHLDCQSKPRQTIAKCVQMEMAVLKSRWSNTW